MQEIDSLRSTQSNYQWLNRSDRFMIKAQLIVGHTHMRIVLMFVQYMRNDEIICIQSMLVIASGLRPMLMDFTDSAMVRYLEQSFRQLLPALFLY